jgi:hypothetical protein
MMAALRGFFQGAAGPAAIFPSRPADAHAQAATLQSDPTR